MAAFTIERNRVPDITLSPQQSMCLLVTARLLLVNTLLLFTVLILIPLPAPLTLLLLPPF